MRTIHHVVDIAAPPATVYRNLTTAQGLAAWWTKKVVADEAVGGKVEFMFMPGFNPTMRIVDLEPARRVKWECVDGVELWRGDTFEFELEARDPGTRLRFWQQYATELPDDDYGSFNFNWAYYLESLRLLCADGAGKPFHPTG
jgi:uncharacterized protein YndB with AHSA1/START domain